VVFPDDDPATAPPVPSTGEQLAAALAQITPTAGLGDNSFIGSPASGVEGPVSVEIDFVVTQSVDVSHGKLHP
jgi:hypothetical protein